MSSIKKNSRCMVILLSLLIFLQILIVVLQWGFIPYANTHLYDVVNCFGLLSRSVYIPAGQQVSFESINWTAVSMSLGIFSDILNTLPSIVGMFLLRLIFKSYYNGEVFTVKNARRYKSLGWIIIANALLISMLSATLLVLAATLSNPPGQRYFTITFGSPNLIILFLGILIVAISRVMLEATVINESKV